MADVFEDVSERLPRLPFGLIQALSGPHENFHYILGDPGSGDAAVVDPAFHLDRLFALAASRGMRVRDAFLTHGHWDHIGGIPGIFELGVERVYVHEAARHHPKVNEALDAGAEVGLASDGDTVMVGDVPVRLLHTPGHQPESMCLLAGAEGGPGALFGGDTLFIDSCGRTDFPGGDTNAMFDSMARLRALATGAPADVHLMPGHHYAQHPHRTLLHQCTENPALATLELKEFSALPFLRGG